MRCYLPSQAQRQLSVSETSISSDVALEKQGDYGEISIHTKTVTEAEGVLELSISSRERMPEPSLEHAKTTAALTREQQKAQAGERGHLIKEILQAKVRQRRRFRSFWAFCTFLNGIIEKTKEQ